MRLVVARVGRPHGVRGEVTVEVRTDAPDERFVPGAVFDVTAPGRSAVRGQARAVAVGPRPPARLTLSGVRDHNGTLLLTFAEIGDRNVAETLRGALLETEVPDASDEPDAWYDHQLVGLRAEAPDGTALGTVTAVEHAPAQDLLVVRRPDGAQRLVPFVAAIVPTVDVDAGRLVVVDPGGLIGDLDES
jgi:16S rRNA processing protein RimM